MSSSSSSSLSDSNVVPTLSSNLLQLIASCVQVSPSSLIPSNIQSVSSSLNSLLSLFDIDREFHVPVSSLSANDIVENISSKIDKLLDRHRDNLRNKKIENSENSMENSTKIVKRAGIVFDPSAKPQGNFTPRVDNSNHVWLPILKIKPNSHPYHPLIDYYSQYKAYRDESKSPEISSAMKSHVDSLDSSSLFRVASNDYSPPHPYEFEISNLSFPKDNIESSTNITMFNPLESTPLTWVDTVPVLTSLAEKLTKCSEFAVDLEHHSYRTYQGFTCLIQISTHHEDFLIDTIALRSSLHILLPSFTHPSILKVLHGADMDILWLQRDFGLYIVNLFDTGQAARVLELPSFSFQHALKFYCDVDTDKKYQLADWRQRPLTGDMAKYARMDTHFLLYIKDRMKAQLIDKSKDEKANIKVVGSSTPVKISKLLNDSLTRSKTVSLKVYKKDKLPWNAHLILVQKSGVIFNELQMEILRQIVQYRDDKAREEDESPGYLCPNAILLNVVSQTPRSVEGLQKACKPAKIPRLFSVYAADVVQIIKNANLNLTKTSPFLLPASKSPKLNSSGPNVEQDDGSWVGLPSNSKGTKDSANNGSVSIMSGNRPVATAKSTRVVLDVDETPDDVMSYNTEMKDQDEGGSGGDYVELNFILPIPPLPNSLPVGKFILETKEHHQSNIVENKKQKAISSSDKSKSILAITTRQPSISMEPTRQNSSKLLNLSIPQVHQILNYHPEFSIPKPTSNCVVSAKVEVKEKSKSKEPKELMILNKHGHTTIGSDDLASMTQRQQQNQKKAKDFTKEIMKNQPKSHKRKSNSDSESDSDSDSASSSSSSSSSSESPTLIPTSRSISNPNDYDFSKSSGVPLPQLLSTVPSNVFDPHGTLSKASRKSKRHRDQDGQSNNDKKKKDKDKERDGKNAKGGKSGDNDRVHRNFRIQSKMFHAK